MKTSQRIALFRILALLLSSSESFRSSAAGASSSYAAAAFQSPPPKLPFAAGDRTVKSSRTTLWGARTTTSAGGDDIGATAPFNDIQNAVASSLGRLFNRNPNASSSSPPKAAVGPLQQRKKELLDAVSFTNNGKSATQEQQSEVLRIVRDLETSYPPSPSLLTDPQLAKQYLDGPWYLQYTSPSQVGDVDQFPDAWKPQNAPEGSANIETTPFQAQGSVSAAGVPVETANRVVLQTIDVDESRVTNDIGLEWGRLVASGTFRPSPTVPNRALVSFDTFRFQFNIGFSIDVGFMFPILKKIRRSQENGWLETTYVDRDVRIGRGNKGTLFVLTRRQDAVTP